VGRAELQAGQARPWLERLPGKERPSHPPSLAAGVLCVFVLLVGIWALTNRRGAGPDEERRSSLRAGKKGEKETQGVLLARDPKSGKGMAGAMDNAQEILAGVLQGAPPRELRTLLEQVFSDRGLYLYVR